MSKRITIEELQSYLWNSAVLLRTNIDAGAYKQYIFPLLFFKRICDVYDEETAKASLNTAMTQLNLMRMRFILLSFLKDTIGTMFVPFQKMLA